MLSVAKNARCSWNSLKPRNIYLLSACLFDFIRGLTPLLMWFMTFLTNTSQVPSYRRDFYWEPSPSDESLHAALWHKPGPVYHPGASPAFWDEYISSEQAVSDDHHKPHIIKCHTEALDQTDRMNIVVLRRNTAGRSRRSPWALTHWTLTL